MCARCGAEDSPHHRYFTCPRILEWPDPDKDILQGQADIPQPGAEAFFFRGLIPYHDWFTDPSGTAFVTPNFSKLIHTANVVAGDGAGPPQGVKGPAQRVAAGLALLVIRNGILEDLAFGYFPVKGRQTVPRAELTAVLEYYRRGGTGHYLSDASYVVRGADEPHHKRHNYEGSVNGDLWTEFYSRYDQINRTRRLHCRNSSQCREDRLGPAQITKVKAHRTTIQAARDGDVHAHLANALADAAAGVGATQYRDKAHEERMDGHMLTATRALRKVVAIELARYQSRPEQIPLQFLEAVPPPPTPAAVRAQHQTTFLRAGHLPTNYTWGFNVEGV